jgi:protoporphyrinogen oxidase
VDSSSLLTATTSVSYFGVYRIIALSSEVTNKLKELEAFDTKLGYHTKKDYIKRLEKDGINYGTNYYPKKNIGVYFWIEHLLQQAQKKGVTILTNEFITTIEHEGKQVKSVTLGNKKETIDCEFLFWSAPPAFALEAAGIPVSQANITLRTANVFHYSYDQPLLNQESYYLWNWDSDYKGFRITLYPNMQPQIEPSLNNLTIEALSTPEEASNITLEEMQRELVKMGLVAENAKVLSQLKQTTHNTFPVPTFEFEQAVQNNCQLLHDTFENMFIAGRHGGKTWFHHDVVKEAYFEIQKRFA